MLLAVSGGSLSEGIDFKAGSCCQVQVVFHCIPMIFQLWLSNAFQLAFQLAPIDRMTFAAWWQCAPQSMGKDQH